MNLEIKALANNEAELRIYGAIGREENNPKDFITALKSTNAETLHVHINSPGGDLFAGHVIYGMIKNFKGKKITYIDGLAASAASIIAMAGDEVVMPKNTLLMIHNASTIAYGDSQEFAKMAENLEKMNATMQAVYHDKTGISTDEIAAMMNNETWFSADEALKLGFVNRIAPEVELNSHYQDDGNLVVNGVDFGNVHAKKLEQFLTIAQAQAKPPMAINTKPNKEVKKMDIQALQAEHPELYKQVEALAFEKGKAEGVKAERTRIQAIEEIAIAGHDKLIVEAKFNTGVSPEALSMQILAAEKNQRSEFLANRQKDAVEVNAITPNMVDPIAQRAANIEAEKDKVPDEFMAVFKAAANKGVTQ